MPLPKLMSEATQLDLSVGWENNPLDGFDLYGMMHGYASFLSNPVPAFIVWLPETADAPDIVTLQLSARE